MIHFHSVIVLITVVLIFVLIQLGQSVGPKSPYQKHIKKDYKIKEKDLKQAKARWINLQREEEWDADMMQRPIDEPPRRQNRELGEICTYSRDCASGCCLLDRSNRVRSCQPKSMLGEKCSAAQVKADLYVDACPCLAGYNFCSYPNEICTK